MSLPDFSTCPAFGRCVTYKGGSYPALDYLISTVDRNLVQFKDDFTSPEGKQFRIEVDKYFANISRYFEVAKGSLSQVQQMELKEKIKDLSSRISSFKGNSGLISWAWSYITPFTSWFAAAPKEAEKSMETDDEGISTVDVEALMQEITVSLKKNKGALEELENTFREIESALSKETDTLRQQVEVLKKRLEGFKEAFKSTHMSHRYYPIPRHNWR